MENNFKKYLKYKKKYLELKSFVGGSEQKKYLNIINPKFCDNGLPDSIYIPELCGSEFPCLNKNKRCYSDKKITDRNIGLDQAKINLFFYKNKFKKLLLNSEKKEKKEASNLISNLHPLGSGGINSVFQLYKFDNENDDITIIDKKVLKLERLNNMEELLNFEINKEFNNNFRIYLDSIKKENLDILKLQKQYINENYEEIKLKVTNNLNDLYKKRRELFIKNSRIIEGLLEDVDIKKYVCQIYDYGYYDIIGDNKEEKSAGVYSIIEKLKGGELFDRLQKFDYLENLEVFKKLMLNIFTGLDNIHKKGFLHMDIKIENIMMVYPIPDKYTEELNEELVNSAIKFIDFDTITEIGEPINKNTRYGTMQNMSPTLVEEMSKPVSPDNSKFDIQDDLYQVGILMIIVLLKQNANSREEYLELLKNNEASIPPELYEIIQILINVKMNENPSVNKIIEYFDSKRFFPISATEDNPLKVEDNPPVIIDLVDSNLDEEDSELSRINKGI